MFGLRIAKTGCTKYTVKVILLSEIIGVRYFFATFVWIVGDRSSTRISRMVDTPNIPREINT
jgi:hypothetical protein